MQAVKPFPDCRQTPVLQLLPSQLQGEQRSLAVVADINLKAGRLVCARHVFGVKGARRSLGEFVAYRHHIGRLKLRERAQQGAGGFVSQAGCGVPIGAQHARPSGNNHRPGPEQPGQGVGVQRAGPAKGGQRIVTRINTLLDRDQPQGAEHFFIHNINDAGRSLFDRHAQTARDRPDGLLGRGEIEHHFSAQLGRCRQIAEHEIGVRDGGLSTTLAVAGRAGVGSGTMRTDPQRRGQFRYVGNRAAARPDRTHINRRRPDRHISDRDLTPKLGFAVLHQGNIGRSAAHIKRQQVLISGLTGHPDGSRDPAGGSAHQQIHRVVAGSLSRGQPTVRAQDVELGLPHGFGQFGLDVAHIGFHHGPDVGIRHRSNGPLILLHFRNDLGRQGNRQTGQFFRRQDTQALFVPAVGIGIDERNGQRFDLPGAQAAQRLAGLGFVQGVHDLARGADAFGHLNRTFQRGQGFALVVQHPATQRARHERARDL